MQSVQGNRTRNRVRGEDELRPVIERYVALRLDVRPVTYGCGGATMRDIHADYVELVRSRGAATVLELIPFSRLLRRTLPGRWGRRDGKVIMRGVRIVPKPLAA